MPIPPGKSGNPGGRPKGSLYPAEAMKMLSGIDDIDELKSIRDGKPLKSLGNEERRKRLRHPACIAAAHVMLDQLNANPDVRRKALETVSDRVEGKPLQVQKIEVDEEERFSQVRVVELPAISQERRKELVDVVEGEGGTIGEGVGLSEGAKRSTPSINTELLSSTDLINTGDST